jgi:hypothetical protein
MRKAALAVAQMGGVVTLVLAMSAICPNNGTFLSEPVHAYSMPCSM